MGTMTRPPSSSVAAACVTLSLGFICGVALASCTKEQQNAVKTVIQVVDKVCDVVPVVAPDAKEVCVTEDEFRRAIKDIVSARGAPGASSAAGATLVVRLP